MKFYEELFNAAHSLLECTNLDNANSKKPPDNCASDNATPSESGMQ